MSKADYIWVRRHLSYCPNTGELRWIKRPGGRAKRGALAGSWTKDWRILIGMKGKVFPIESIVWLWNKGRWPCGPLAHRNGDWLDNRIENLIFLD